MKRCNYLLLSEGGKCTGWFWVDMGNEYAKDCQQAQNTGDRWDLSLASTVEPFSGAEVPTGAMECRPNPNGRFSSLQACEEELRRQNQTGLAVAAGGTALVVAGLTAPAWAPAAAAASAPLVYQAGQAYVYAQPALQTVQRVSTYAGAAGASVGIVGEATGNTRLADVGRGVTEVALGVGGAAEALNALGAAASFHGSFSGGYLDRTVDYWQSRGVIYYKPEDLRRLIEETPEDQLVTLYRGTTFSQLQRGGGTLKPWPVIIREETEGVSGEEVFREALISAGDPYRMTVSHAYSSSRSPGTSFSTSLSVAREFALNRSNAYEGVIIRVRLPRSILFSPSKVHDEMLGITYKVGKRPEWLEPEKELILWGEVPFELLEIMNNPNNLLELEEFIPYGALVGP
jgi:hypothetical protein